MPKCFVAPFYKKKNKVYPVALGNTLKPSKTKDSPSLKIYCPELQQTSGLTIILTDPDAPSRDNPKWSEMCHWIGIIPTEGQYPFEFTLSKMKNKVVKCVFYFLRLAFAEREQTNLLDHLLRLAIIATSFFCLKGIT